MYGRNLNLFLLVLPMNELERDFCLSAYLRSNRSKCLITSTLINTAITYKRTSYSILVNERSKKKPPVPTPRFQNYSTVIDKENRLPLT